MSVCVLIMSNNRKLYLKPTWASAVERLLNDEAVTQVVVHEDSGDVGMWAWIQQNFGGPIKRVDMAELPVTIIGRDNPRGFAGAINTAWSYLTELVEEPYVFHLEDDFTFNRAVPLGDMIHVLEHHPYLVQLALRRQAWSAHEKLAGGVIEQHPDAYAERQDARGNAWLEHRLFWTTNPSLYRRALCAVGWPTGPQSEGLFSHQLIQNDPDLRFGYLGRRDDEPWVHHIGTDRMGGRGY